MTIQLTESQAAAFFAKINRPLPPNVIPFAKPKAAKKKAEPVRTRIPTPVIEPTPVIRAKPSPWLLLCVLAILGGLYPLIPSDALALLGYAAAIGVAWNMEI